MNARTWIAGAAIVLGTTAAQCSTQDPDGSESDSSRVARLEGEARALAKTDGCSSADQCRSAPVGDRPCGGPRTYIVYCARSTDSAALYRKLDELREAERQLNTKSGRASTCEFRMPPATGLSGGQCAATP